MVKKKEAIFLFLYNHTKATSISDFITHPTYNFNEACTACFNILFIRRANRQACLDPFVIHATLT